MKPTLPSPDKINAAIERLNKLLSQRERPPAGEVSASIDRVVKLLGQENPYVEQERQWECRQAIIDAMKPPRARRSL